MPNALQRFSAAVNILPMEEPSLTLLNRFLSIFSDEDPVDSILDLSPDVSLLQCTYLSKPDIILQPMLQYLANCGVSDREFANLQRVCVKATPEHLGFFLRQEHLTSSVGWTLAGPLPFSVLNVYLPKGKTRQLVQSWAATHNITNCISYSRIVGPGAQWEEMTLAVPSVDVCLAFFDAAKLVLPPRPLIKVAKKGSTSFALTVWFAPDGGLIRAALRAHDPTTRLTLASRLEIPTIAESNLAVLEGYLQVTQPSWIEMGRNSNGRDALLGYHLANTDPT